MMRKREEIMTTEANNKNQGIIMNKKQENDAKMEEKMIKSRE